MISFKFQDILTFNTTALQTVLDFVVDMGVVQHGLGGNTTNVQASTTKGATLFDTSSLLKK